MNQETPEQEQWVAFKEQGDDDAREQLIIKHMRIVKYVAGRMAIHVPSSVELNDLVGWGVLGLMDAVEKFDHLQNIKFTTYATIRIRGSIIDQIRTLDWAPRSLRAMARKVGGARDKLRHELGHEPSFEQIGSEIESTEEQVEDCLAQIQTAHVLSLDDYLPGGDSDENRKLDVTSDPDAPTPESAVSELERQELLVQAILALPDQQQKVLNLYYYEELTLKEIGAVLEVSESRISQIHSAAIKKLKKVVRNQGTET